VKNYLEWKSENGEGEEEEKVRGRNGKIVAGRRRN
jgi:hypothetical protein